MGLNEREKGMYQTTTTAQMYNRMPPAPGPSKRNPLTNAVNHHHNAPSNPTVNPYQQPQKMPSVPAMGPYKTAGAQPRAERGTREEREKEKEREGAGKENGAAAGGKEGEPPLPRQNVKVRPPTPPKVISDKSGRMNFNRVGFLGEVSCTFVLKRIGMLMWI